MKFAVLSDIHSNLAALEAITEDIERWKPDRVIVNGDVVNRGPQPAECWRFVQHKIKSAGWHLTRGNHEEYVLRHTTPESDKVNHPMSWWTLQQIKPHIIEMEAMETVWSYLGDDQMGELRVIHASMMGSRAGIYPSDSIDRLRERISPAPAVLCVGHVHLPFVRVIDQTLLVNSGSAGQPCYGEKKGCYAQIEWKNGGWSAEIRRIPYDRQATQKAWFESGIFEATDWMTHIIYHEWRTTNPLVLKWMFEYLPKVERGEAEGLALMKTYLDRENLGAARPDNPL